MVRVDKKKKKVKLVVLLVSVLCLFIGGSYAYWLMTSTQTETNIASSKCFKVSITNESDAISITKAHPVTDEEGLKETGYFKTHVVLMLLIK